MTLNSSGPISLGGATTGQSIALELGQSATGQISLNDTNVRTLAGVSSGAIVMPLNFWGKSSAANYALFFYQTTRGSGDFALNSTFSVNADKSVTVYGVDVRFSGCTGIDKLYQYNVSSSGSVSNVKLGSTTISHEFYAFAANLGSVISSTGDIYIVSANSSSFSSLIYKFNSSGVLQAVKTISSMIAFSFSPSPIAVDASNNIYIVSQSVYPQRIYKFDASLNQLGYFDAAFNYYYPANGATLAKNLNTLTGLVYSFSYNALCDCGYFNSVLAKDKNWFVGFYDYWGDYVITNVDLNGNVYILYSNGGTSPYTSYGLNYIKFNSTGTRQFSIGFSYADGINWQKIIFDSSGNSYIIFMNQSYGYPIYIIKYNSSGVQQWARELGSSAGYNSQIYDAQISSNDPNNIYLTFTTDLNVNNSILIKLPTDGSLTQTFFLAGDYYTYAASTFTGYTGYAWTSTPYTYSPSSTSFTVSTGSDTLSSSSAFGNAVDIL